MLAAPAADPPPPRRSGRAFSALAYRDPAPSPALIAALGPINRHLVLRGLLRLVELDVPRADLERLRGAVRPGGAAFVGPNHPEFTTDWMLDKELAERVSPLMAHWASYEIVNTGPRAQAFWLRNNLIANVPGGGGREYSVRWALAGHGVLLHPEGTVSWHGDRVEDLLPGIVEMAWETCRRAREAGDARPVWIVPVVWKLHFVRDEAGPLAREMAHIERALALPAGDGQALERRFAALLRHLLAAQARRLDLAPPADVDDLFAAQAAAADGLLGALEARHGTCEGDVLRLQRAVRRAGRRAPGDEARRERARMDELVRLRSLDPALYGGPSLTQERIAEVLQHTRSLLVAATAADRLHNLLPRAVGPRVAHLRAPEPLAVHEAFAAAPDAARAARAALLDALRARMQATLDALNAELAPAIERFRRPNPLHRPLARD